MTQHDHTQALLEEFDHNGFDGSASLDELSAAKYGVVVERDDDSWVLAANTDEELARIMLACYVDTDGYDEWIARIVNLATGEPVTYTHTVKLTANIEGRTVTVGEPV